ncbi:MAG: hypothetical protein K5787_13880 [Lentisphaeria bacterium]|nr:hypothetical protein [Victivallales bacterium]MBR6059821.1 hypothetical protein [Victivallales bacterium]MCR4574842.1 hypothetical protein [Lentisphaeria bacterium]
MLYQCADYGIHVRAPNIVAADIAFLLLAENQQKNADQYDEMTLEQGKSHLVAREELLV